MASRIRGKMPVENRAKQFMPFAALKGLPEALAEKERVRVEKREITEDMAEELDRKMQRIKQGEKVVVVYYEEGEYIKIKGMVSKVDRTFGILQIVDTKISIEDILEIEQSCNFRNAI